MEFWIELKGWPYLRYLFLPYFLGTKKRKATILSNDKIVYIKTYGYIETTD